MATHEQIRWLIAEQFPDPGTDPVARLRHVNAVFADTDPDGWAVTATVNIHGEGVTTGLTFADLRVLRGAIAEEIAQAIEAAGRDPHQNLAWMYPNQAARIVREQGR